ncbi:hypothetical protein C6P45_002469 [Maudiozyma exigua]|uniref:Flavodoxin-like fold domain-containing protein n=1 Tax=Maudiozyma exigua TaxID=34358 RepID=A0A9P6WCL2_MAUEX|nr:hypothetical protein C6P45_002469 [Kazachstania exigua]
MKVLFVIAHPDKNSFNHSLLDAAVKRLESQGNEVKVSDLYAMTFKAIVDADDFLNHEEGTRLKVGEASFAATESHQLTDDVVAEQEKLKWADTVIFQFPIWWSSMPAMMKGWFDRVFSSGFGYNYGIRTDTRYGDRFGEGVMEGKRAFIITTIGSSKEQYSERGISGSINDILFPINHNTLFYAGFSVLPPIVTFRADSRREEVYVNAEKAVLERMDNLATVEPIHYRRQNFGDYTIPELTLKEGLEQPDQAHFDIHIERV